MIAEHWYFFGGMLSMFVSGEIVNLIKYISAKRKTDAEKIMITQQAFLQSLCDAGQIGKGRYTVILQEEKAPNEVPIY